MTLGILLLIILGVIIEVWWFISGFKKYSDNNWFIMWAIITILNGIIVVGFIGYFIGWVCALPIWSLKLF